MPNRRSSLPVPVPPVPVQGPTFAAPNTKLSARDRLLETARTLFYQRGINNVGIDEIIAQSGVAKATLYKHFASKDALILEYMRQGDARWVAWLQSRVEQLSATSNHTSDQPLLAVFGALAEWYALPHFRGCLLTNVVVSLPEPQHAARAVLTQHREHVRAYFETLAQDAGRPDAPRLADVWMMLMDGATAAARAEANPEAARRAEVYARQLLLDGERNRPALGENAQLPQES
jgi:AcrR family transcriptional regulator